MALSLLQVVAIGCGDDAPASVAQPVVMVVDDGFDLSLPLFQRRVVASFTVECNADAGAGPDAAPLTGGPGDGSAPDARPFAEAKAAALAELAQPENSCHLRPGIAARPNPFADLEAQRGRWNAGIRADQLAGNMFRRTDLDPLYDQLAMRLAGVHFHGTATAGLIASENPGARLVLIERPLQSMDEVEQTFTCIDQSEVDEAVALLSDAEVRAAYLARPSSLDHDITQAMRAHGVGIVNESFGRLSRFGLEKLLFAKRCPPVSFGPYLARLSDLERARDQGGPAVLVMKAAGNDGALTTGAEDDAECQPDNPRRVLVGSYGYDRRRSWFSNFGPCVDVYAPGERVLAPLPGDWVFPLDGTSFSTPMAVRLLVMTVPTPFDPAAARTDLLARREPNRDLSLRLFPPSLLYDPRPKEQALTLREARPPRLDGVALRRTLAPLRWVQHGYR
jgi:subtilisin family serine protease